VPLPARLLVSGSYKNRRKSKSFNFTVDLRQAKNLLLLA